MLTWSPLVWTSLVSATVLASRGRLGAHRQTKAGASVVAELEVEILSKNAKPRCELILRRGPCLHQPRIRTGLWFSFQAGERPKFTASAAHDCRLRLQAWRSTCGPAAILQMRLGSRQHDNRTAASRNVELARLTKLLTPVGLERFVPVLVVKGHTVSRLTRMSEEDLDFLAAGQLGDPESRQRFVAAVYRCARVPKRALPTVPARGACIASTLNVAPLSRWRALFTSLRQASFGAIAVVVPVNVSKGAGIVGTDSPVTALRSKATFLALGAPNCGRDCAVARSVGGARHWLTLRLQSYLTCWTHFEEVERKRVSSK